MKRSIAVVAAGRGLTILWVFATAQVMCSESDVDGDSAEVYRVVSENKIGLVTQMITNRGLEKASRQFHMSPLRVADINPIADDEEATAVEPQPPNRRRRLRPRAPAYAAEDNTETGTAGRRPEMRMSQATDNRPDVGDVETMATGADDRPTARDDELRGHLEGLRVRRVKAKKGLGDPRRAAMNQL